MRRRAGARPRGDLGRYDGEGRSPVTDGSFAETKDLIAGWMAIDVDSYGRVSRRRRTNVHAVATRLHERMIEGKQR